MPSPQPEPRPFIITKAWLRAGTDNSQYRPNRNHSTRHMAPFMTLPSRTHRSVRQHSTQDVVPAQTTRCLHRQSNIRRRSLRAKVEDENTHRKRIRAFNDPDQDSDFPIGVVCLNRTACNSCKKQGIHCQRRTPEHLPDDNDPLSGEVPHPLMKRMTPGSLRKTIAR